MYVCISQKSRHARSSVQADRYAPKSPDGARREAFGPSSSMRMPLQEVAARGEGLRAALREVDARRTEVSSAAGAGIPAHRSPRHPTCRRERPARIKNESPVTASGQVNVAR